LRIQLQKTATSYQIRSGLLNDAGTWTDSSWYDVPNAWSAVEIRYQAFANSGSLTLWLDDVQKQSLTFIDNDTRTLTDVRLGAQGVDAGTNGTLYFDDFESRRFSYIGTLTDPGVDDPQATNQAGWFTRTYQYSASIPHAVTSVNPETGSPDTYEYDLNGNMICRIENGVTYTHTYNAENRASSIAKRTGDCATGTILESWSFAYDGDGNRVTTAHFTGTSGTPDSVTSYFMGGQYEVKDGAVKKYYSIAGMMVAVNDGTGLQYLLTDHLGSTVAVTNASGTLTSQQRYLPFGGTRTIPNSPILGTDFGYTGQRMLDEDMGGIMDYRARFYSPALSRFLQPDTIIPDQSNPQSWNRLSYVVNNPIRYNDPTGHCFGPVVVICGEIIVGIAVLAAVELTIYYTINTPEGERLRNQAANGISNTISKINERVNKEVIKKVHAFNQFVADTQSSDKIPNYNCWKATYCIPEILALLGVVLYAGTHGGCNEDESLTRCPSPTTSPTPTSTSTSAPTATSTQTPTPTLTTTPTSTPTQTPTIPPPSITPRIVPNPRRIKNLVEMQ
jgi:RHS repeat-associated protein